MILSLFLLLGLQVLNVIFDCSVELGDVTGVSTGK